MTDDRVNGVFLLDVDSVPAYLAAHPELGGPVDVARLASVVEVGDGNLNLVFIVKDAAGAGVVLKQSLPHVRTDPSWPMTRERNTREVRILGEHGRIDAEHVPALYGFVPEDYVIAMEDLSDHRVWRAALNAGEVHGYAAVEIGRHVARVGFGTSVFGLTGPAKRVLVAAATNPELSEITEDLVFSEPYVDHEHNRVLPANEPDVAVLRADGDLRREIGLAKIRFQDSTQSLLHGDLHTGSVMLRPKGGFDGSGPGPGSRIGSAGQAGEAEASRAEGSAVSVAQSVRAFDSEFGAFGPTGFDLGALWANLVIAAARAEALGEPERAAAILELPPVLWEEFEAEYRSLWPTRVDPRVFGDEVLESVLAEIRSDAAAFAGAKAIRRIIGFAKASDIESLPEDIRAGAARAVLFAGRALALDRLRDSSPRALTERTAALLAEHARL